MTRTRAKGVEEAAKCEFVTFIDRDDILKINSLQIFNNDFSENTDIVMSRMDIINEEELIDRLFNAIPTEKQHLYKTFFLERRFWAWERRYNNQINRFEYCNRNFHKLLISDINSKNTH